MSESKDPKIFPVSNGDKKSTDVAASTHMTGGDDTMSDDDPPDPLRNQLPSHLVRENDHVVLVFADGRQLFAQCVYKWKGRAAPLKISKSSISTANLIGLPYGTVLELDKKKNKLVPLPEGEDLLATDVDEYLRTGDGDSQDDGDYVDSDYYDSSTARPSPVASAIVEYSTDNRHLDDTNTSQTIKYDDIVNMREKMHGAEMVKVLIEGSSTFDSKTEFSKAKYIARKQKKYQIRCRLVRCTASSICEALFLKDPRRLMRLRVDTLAQLLSYSNVTAGSQVLVMETCMGLVTGAFAQRMGGYGRVISVYSGQQPSYIDLLSKFNLTFAENHSIKWVHAGDVFAKDAINADTSKIPDQEREEREAMEWPCPLQDHTRKYLEEECTDPKQQEEFLAKRASRFARKLTRYTPVEVQEMLVRRPCDSLVIACSYDPTETLLALLPFLAPSSPFVVFCEYLEPLTECFQEIQKQKLAINVRLSDTWMREYQVLSGRTRPAMHMSQNGGFLLVGVKLCPETGNQDLDEKLLEEIRANLRPRRSRKPKEKRSEDGDEQAAIKRSKVA